MSEGLKLLGKIDIPTAGTRVQLETVRRMAKSVRIEADEDNAAAIVFVGDATVSGDKYAARLAANESFTISGSAIDMRTIWLDTDTNGADVQVSWL